VAGPPKGFTHLSRASHPSYFVLSALAVTRASLIAPTADKATRAPRVGITIGARGSPLEGVGSPSFFAASLAVCTPATAIAGCGRSRFVSGGTLARCIRRLRQHRQAPTETLVLNERTRGELSPSAALRLRVLKAACGRSRNAKSAPARSTRSVNATVRSAPGRLRSPPRVGPGCGRRGPLLRPLEGER